MDITIETYILDGIKSSAPIRNTDDPDIRASLAANVASMTRPLLWQDSDDRYQWIQCANVAQTLKSLNLPSTIEALPPCVVNANRIAAFNNDPRYGPYFLHVWGWKWPYGRGGPRVSIQKNDPVYVQPQLRIFNTVAPLDRNSPWALVPLTPISQPFSAGANIFALTNDHLSVLTAALNNSLFINSSGIVFDFEVYTTDISSGPTPLSRGGTPSPWAVYDNSYSEYVCQRLEVVDNGDIDRTVACGGVSPAALNFCFCASKLKNLPVGCQSVCQCVDPVGYYQYLRGAYICPLGLNPGECQ